MKRLYLDIETLPAEEEKHEILRGIFKRKAEKREQKMTVEEFIKNSNLDGAFGRICCLSYAIDDLEVKTLSGTEKEILEEFWQIAKDADLFIGFNVMDFDLRFIYQRSIVWGVKPTRDLNFARYRNSPIYDLMYEWAKWNTNWDGKISLDALAKALDLPSSKGGAIEGKDVAQAYLDGRLKEICLYCEKDVELTRKIYKRMIFE